MSETLTRVVSPTVSSQRIMLSPCETSRLIIPACNKCAENQEDYIWVTINLVTVRFTICLGLRAEWFRFQPNSCNEHYSMASLRLIFRRLLRGNSLFFISLGKNCVDISRWIYGDPRTSAASNGGHFNDIDDCRYTIGGIKISGILYTLDLCIYSVIFLASLYAPR